MRYRSTALGRDDSYLAYLPPGYDASARSGCHFPVLYLLHGDGSTKRHTARHLYRASHLRIAVDRLVGAGVVPPFITVIPETDGGTVTGDTEWANTRRGNYESSVVDLVHNADARFATIPARAARGIAGLSMGGYGAVNVGFHHPDLFSVIESWSGYFRQPEGPVFRYASAADNEDNSPLAYVPGERSKLELLPMHVLLYASSDDPLSEEQGDFARLLQSIEVPVDSAFFRGPHDYRFWRRHLPLALGFAGRYLQPAD